MADVLNNYVIAPSKEKIWTVLCTIFKDDACKSTIIVTALYHLKSAGASFRACLCTIHARVGV